ncbi:MAG: sulfite exporter TauE/SafE family protein [Brachybacterium tyrofermentans]|uniref:sulfite exporter TauE/SafE family protein n=1 Tax=Brachybacterium tyrofermentans TaxID=47848 RepID=UPI00186819DB|nr:sulfite exporter TauE/SafE family protein [Brachybacterium tyrofermentans]
MEPLSLIVLLVMGTLAGAINAAVGSGSLLTLPVLMALGIPPGVAVRTNTVGMLFSTIGSVVGYRKEIDEEKHDLPPLVLTAAGGAILGSLLLLVSPASALDVVVPVLIVVALAMVVFQKRITAALRARSDRRRAARGPVAPTSDGSDRSPLRSPALVGSMGAASIYGGYFTAAQGILYLGILGTFTGRTMGSVNSVKNLLSLVVNLAAATIYVIAHFVIGAEIVWLATAAIAVGALIGGYFGAHLAKLMPEWLLRGIIVVVALIALVRQFI